MHTCASRSPPRAPRPHGHRCVPLTSIHTCMHTHMCASHPRPCRPPCLLTTMYMHIARRMTYHTCIQPRLPTDNHAYMYAHAGARLHLRLTYVLLTKLLTKLLTYLLRCAPTSSTRSAQSHTWRLSSTSTLQVHAHVQVHAHAHAHLHAQGRVC